MRIKAELTEKDPDSWSVSDDYQMQRFYLIYGKKEKLISSIKGCWEISSIKSLLNGRKQIEINITHHSTGSPEAHFWCNEIVDKKGNDLLHKLMLRKLSKSK